MDSSPTSRTDQRPRPKSAFSFRSHRSSESGASRPKIDDLVETEKERRKSRYTGKDYSNPNKAINDAQPIAVAQEAATLAPLRASQHKDWQGNAITDPDSSNPSRSRLERPLDTIRSFEAAVDSSYKRRTQVLRTESAGDVLQTADSRRSSVVGTDYNINPRSPAAIPGPTMYKSSSSRHPSTQHDGYNQHPQYPQYSRGPPPNAFRRSMAPRQQSAPLPHRSSQYEYNNGYPHPSYADPYETAGDSSGSPSEPWGASTDPSSENSSIDRINTLNRQSENDAYGHQFGRGSPKNAPIAEEQYNLGWSYEQSYENEQWSAVPPAPPPHQQPRQSREYDARPPVAASRRSPQSYQRPGSGYQPQYQPRQQPQAQAQPQQQLQQQPQPQRQQQQQQQQQQTQYQQAHYQQPPQQQKQPQYTAAPNRYPPPNGASTNPFRQGRDKPLPPPSSSYQPQRPRTLQKKTSDPPKKQSWFKRAFGKN